MSVVKATVLFFLKGSMARTRSSKRDIFFKLEEKLAKSKSVVFSSFKGLRAKETEEIRSLLHKENLEVMMAKKTLLRRVLQKAGITDLDPKGLEGEITATFSYADEVAPARLLAKYGKEHENLKIVAGLIMSAPVESRFISAAGVIQLSKLPSREELLSKAVGSLASPLRGLVGVLQGNLRGLVQVLKAASESRS